MNEFNGVWGHRMGRTISRLIIAQALMACLLPLSAWAKLSQCQDLLLPNQSADASAAYTIGTIKFGLIPEKNKPMGILNAKAEIAGIDDESKDNSLLWLIRGTANVDSLPREKDIGDGDIVLAFPVELEDGRTFKVTFLYEQSNPKNSPRFGVLKEIEILDEVSFKVKVKPETKETPDLEDLIYKVSHGPRGKIYGLNIADTNIPFKSHISPEELDQYKEFFSVFYEYRNYFTWYGQGRIRKPDDLDKVNSLAELDKLTGRLVRDNKYQWYWDRAHKWATGGVLALTMIGSVAGFNYYQNVLNAPKEYVVNDLVNDKYGEIKLYASTSQNVNIFKVSGDDDVRIRNESSIILKDKKGTQFVFKVQRSPGKNKIRLQLLSTELPKSELAGEIKVDQTEKAEKPERIRERD